MREIIIFITSSILSCIVFISCHTNDETCEMQSQNLRGNKFKIKGCLIDNVENGEWIFYDEKGNLSERGFFERGFRIGNWHYPQNYNDTVIIWKRYEKTNLKLDFNIPVGLELLEDSTNYIKFSTMILRNCLTW